MGAGFVLDFISVWAHGVQPSEQMCEPQITGHWLAARYGTGVKPSAVNNVETTTWLQCCPQELAAIAPFLFPLLLAIFSQSVQLDVGHAM